MRCIQHTCTYLAHHELESVIIVIIIIIMITAYQLLPYGLLQDSKCDFEALRISSDVFAQVVLLILVCAASACQLSPAKADQRDLRPIA